MTHPIARPSRAVLWIATLCAIAAVWTIAAATMSSQAPTGNERQTELVDGRSAVAGDVLVQFASDTADEVGRAAQAVNAETSHRLVAGWHRLHSSSGSVKTMLAALASRRGIVAVEPNYIVHTTAIPNDPLFPQLWGLNNTTVPGADIHAVNAWNVSTGSTGLVVGVVDTGIDYTHPDLADNVWSAPASFTVSIGGQPLTCPAGSHGFNAITFSCDPKDDNGHGTHTSGTIGAMGNNGVGVVGVNWTTRIMGLKFLDSSGSGSTADAISAIEFAIQAKAAFAATGGANVRVLSNSWGGGGQDNSLLAEINQAFASDMLFVAAAGNNSSNNDAVPFYPASFAAGNMVAVAASDSTDHLAGFSNYGPTSVALAAPGVGIVSTYQGGYTPLSGTSMATPHVAGAAALVLSQCSLSTSQLKNTILSTVDTLSAFNGIVATGGRLNVDRAIRSCPTGGQSQTLFTTQVPVTQSIGTGVTWELGLRVTSDVAGQITAIRFWKSPNENGPHTGHLWSATGQPLASVTFSNETASGWQQQLLTAPVAILANTAYVVSVNTAPNSYYAMTSGFFVTPLTNGHLTASTGNGLYSSPNATGTFPTFTFQGDQYFRDVVFVPQSGGDTTPPTVSISAPANGSTVSGPVTISATASDNVGVSSVQFAVDGINLGSAETTAPYSVTWDSTTVADGPHTVTATASDAAGNQATASITVTTANGIQSQTLFTTQVPVTQSIGSGVTWELGLRVTSDVAGQITAIRFWKSPNENGPHTGHLWSATGQPLASVTFSNETASGWQQQLLTAPVAILANTAYVVSVNTAPNSYYAMTSGFFVTPLTNGHLTASTGNGLYSSPNATGTFPTFTFQGDQYFRDVVFVPQSGGDTTPPTVSISAPANGSTVSGPVTISATASDNVGVSSVQFAVDGINLGSAETTAPYSVTWDSTTVADGPHTVTATASDAAGNQATASITVTTANGIQSQTLFTTQVPVTQSIGTGVTWELGLQVTSDVAGQITAIRFWKSPSENGPHTGHIWSATGQLLASVTFANETASGWQQQALLAPVAILANTAYVVSVNTAPNSYYAMTSGFFVTPLTNGHLTASTGNGLYSSPNATGTFPTFTFQGDQYFRDIVFVPQ